MPAWTDALLTSLCCASTLSDVIILICHVSSPRTKPPSRHSSLLSRRLVLIRQASPPSANAGGRQGRALSPLSATTGCRLLRLIGNLTFCGSSSVSRRRRCKVHR